MLQLLLRVLSNNKTTTRFILKRWWNPHQEPITMFIRDKLLKSKPDMIILVWSISLSTRKVEKWNRTLTETDSSHFQQRWTSIIRKRIRSKIWISASQADWSNKLRKKCRQTTETDKFLKTESLSYWKKQKDLFIKWTSRRRSELQVLLRRIQRKQ